MACSYAPCSVAVHRFLAALATLALLILGTPEVSAVGAVELKRGATVAGWVAVEQGAIDPQSCRARLAPLVASGRMSEKMQKTVREVAVRKDGFFQLNAVAPGNYLLEVRQKGFAAGTAEVAVSPRTETFLRDPITLKRPFQLALLLSPLGSARGSPNSFCR